VVAIAPPWRWHKVVARIVYVLAGVIVIAAPYLAFDYCVLTPFAMSILIAVGPARRLAEQKTICRQCGGAIDRADGRSGVFTARDRERVMARVSR
jgi:hypothetical protein